MKLAEISWKFCEVTINCISCVIHSIQERFETMMHDDANGGSV